MSRAIEATICGAAFALLAASVAAGQAAKPNYKDFKTVEAWMTETKIDQGGATRFDKTWLVIGVGPEGVYLTRRLLDSTNARPGKFTIVVNRLELFEPLVDGPRSINSISFDHEIDCLHRSSRRLLLTTYTRHNLVGQPVTEKIDEPHRPFKEDAMLFPIADDICSAIE